MLSGSSDPDGALALGSLLGVWCFFKGFRRLREYRVIEDVPQIPIRSVPMGLVKVRGTASGAKTIASPISKTACYFYRVEVERWHSGRDGGWKHHCTDLHGGPLYLQDGTGQILVEPQRAELDLPQTGRRVVNSENPADAEFLRYVTQAEMDGMTNYLAGKLTRHGPSDDPKREQLRSSLLDVLAATQSAVHDGNAAPAAQAMRHLIEASGPLADPEKEQRRQQMIAGTGLVAAMGGLPLGLQQAASGQYRLTEFCIVPHQEYEATGSCVENPQASGEQDRNLITRGQHEQTFVISSKQEPQLESWMRGRALLMVGGGAALTLVCLALLLARYHYF